jgi:20S proteasome subunit alpha 7
LRELRLNQSSNPSLQSSARPKVGSELISRHPHIMVSSIRWILLTSPCADTDILQTSIGTGYDLSNSVFSPDGRNFQVEYAVKAVENGGTCIGIRTKHGVVLAVEKIITSKLLKPNANKRIATVDRNVGIVTSGLLPDGRHLTSRARDEASSWRRTYKAPIPMSALASRLGGYVQAYTLYSSVRPFGISAIVGGWDSEAEMPVDGQVGEGPKTGAGGKASFDEQDVRRGGPGLYMIEPSGLYWVSYIGYRSSTSAS